MIFSKAAILFGCLAAFATADPAARMLRRRRGLPGAANGKTFPPEMCMNHVPHWWYMVGEKTKADGMFMMHNPDLTQHRKLLGYTDEHIEKMWDESIENAWKFAGIDFRNAEYNEEKGMMEIDGFKMMPVTMDFGLRMIATKDQGHMDCPQTFGDEAIVVIATKDGTYHGTFGQRVGGEAGAPAFAGEIAVAYGHYAFDLDQDGKWEEVLYYSNSPMRNILGATRIDCDVVHPEWGVGRNTGKLEVKNIGVGNKPHGTVRAWASFPYGFDFDKQYCYVNNNFCKQWNGEP